MVVLPSLGSRYLGNKKVSDSGKRLCRFRKMNLSICPVPDSSSFSFVTSRKPSLTIKQVLGRDRADRGIENYSGKHGDRQLLQLSTTRHCMSRNDSAKIGGWPRQCILQGAAASVSNCPSSGQNPRAIVPEDDSRPAGVMMNAPPCAIDSTGHASWRSQRRW